MRGSIIVDPQLLNIFGNENCDNHYGDNQEGLFYYFFSFQCSPHIEPSPLVYSSSQLSDFYMSGTVV